jgi:hypothetical protein
MSEYVFSADDVEEITLKVLRVLAHDERNFATGEVIPQLVLVLGHLAATAPTEERMRATVEEICAGVRAIAEQARRDPVMTGQAEEIH